MKLLLLLLLASIPARAESFRILGFNEKLGAGDIISIVSVSPGASGLWVEGRRVDDEIGGPALVAGDRGPNSSTRWKVIETTAGIYSFQCLAFSDGPMWLDGHTRSGEVVLALSPHGVSGAGWGFYREGAGFNLKCLGSVRGKRWLVAAAPEGVAMALEPDNAPSLWQIYLWTRGAPAEKPLR